MCYRFLLFCLSLLLIIGCKDNSTDLSNDEKDTENNTSNDNYLSPSNLEEMLPKGEIGTKYEYSITNTVQRSNTNKVDTNFGKATKTILARNVLTPDSKYKAIKIAEKTVNEGRISFDTLYYAVANSTLIEYRSLSYSSSYDTAIIVKMPLQKGNSWKQRRSMTCHSLLMNFITESINAPLLFSGKNYETIRILLNYEIYSQEYSKSVSYAKNIGMIKQLITQKQNWAGENYIPPTTMYELISIETPIK